MLLISFNTITSSAKHRFFLFLTLCTILFCSCKKTDLSPVTGTYIGEVELEQWGFEELFDDVGNFVGIKETRDTLYSQQDALVIKKGSKNDLFTLSGDGNLVKVNGFSSHEFSYSGQQDFSVVELTNGQETRRLEFTIDGNGKISLQYTDNQFSDDRPPVGNKITFTGSSN